MTYGTAKENGGRTPSARNAPDVSGSKVYALSAYQTIEFVEIVDGSKVVSDKWLKLPDGNFVNYIVSGVQYFDILTNPGIPPPAGVLPVVVTVELEGYKPLILNGNMEPLE